MLLLRASSTMETFTITNPCRSDASVTADGNSSLMLWEFITAIIARWPSWGNKPSTFLVIPPPTPHTTNCTCRARWGNQIRRRLIATRDALVNDVPGNTVQLQLANLANIPGGVDGVSGLILARRYLFSRLRVLKIPSVFVLFCFLGLPNSAILLYMANKLHRLPMEILIRKRLFGN